MFLSNHAGTYSAKLECAQNHNFFILSAAGLRDLDQNGQRRGFFNVVGKSYGPEVEGRLPFDEWLLKIQKQFDIDKTLKLRSATRKIQNTFRLDRAIWKAKEDD